MLSCKRSSVSRSGPPGTVVGTMLVAAVVATLGLAGCGQRGEPEAAAPEPPSQPTTTSTAQEASTPKRTVPAQTATEASVQSATPEKPGMCPSGQLRLSLGRGDAGAGTHWRPLRFTNKSDEPCVLHGFPGVSYVAGDDGHQVGAAAYRDGEKGPAVTLKPGETAHAPVGFTQIRNFDVAACQPTPVRGLRIYPPQETKALFLENPGTGCANPALDGHQLKVQTIKPGAGM